VLGEGRFLSLAGGANAVGFVCVSVKLVVKCPRSNLATIVQEVTTEWEIRAMPTFLFIKDGKQIDKIVGANKADLEKKCHYYATNQS
jgi:hypothetical protein